MPGRCSCPGSSCGCAIQAGPGIQVEGTGTVDTPFIVSIANRSISIDQSSQGALDLTPYFGDPVVNVSLGANVTGVLLPDAAGTRIELVVTQGAASRTIVWPTSIKWAAGAPPVLSAAVGQTDWISLRQVTASQWLGRVLGSGIV